MSRFTLLWAATAALLACRPANVDEWGARGDSGDGGQAAVGNGATSSSTGGNVTSGGNSGGGSAPAPNVASIVTWNLEAYPLTNQAEDQAVSLLQEMLPDMVALQEISEPAAFEALVSRLDGYAGVMNNDPGAYIRVGLLWRTDRVTVEDVETLFPSDWYGFPRPPLKARVRITGQPDIDFVAVVLHLKAQLDNESQARRRDGCEKLDAWVRAQQAAGPEQDFVLLGDLNDKVTDPPQWNVFTPFLDHPNNYVVLTLPAAAAGNHTYIPFQSFIDHVIVTTDTLDEIGNGETEVLALEDTIANYRDLTDHRPVRTWFRW